MPKYPEMKKQIAQLQAEAEAVRKKEVGEVVSSILALMDAYGLTAADLKKPVAPARSKAPAVPRKVEAKYRDPVSGSTWSGRGKPPAWIADAFKSRQLDAFLIPLKTAKPAVRQASTPRRRKSLSIPAVASQPQAAASALPA